MKQAEQPRTEEAQVRNNPREARYELRIDGALAGFASYRDEGDRLVFTHTEVQQAYQGQGLASQLAAQALDDVKRQGRKAVPQCAFIAHFMDRHRRDYEGMRAEG